jgi:hypothetical protein
MSRRVQENLIAIAFLIVFLGVIVLCLDFGVRARKVPLPVAVFGLILIVIQIVWQNLRSTEDLQVDLLKVLTRREEREIVPEEGAGAPVAADSAPNSQRPSWRREAGAYGIIAALLAMVLLFGPIPAIFVFTGGYFILSKHYSWRKGLIYTTVFTVVVYLVFVTALQIQLYHGVLAPLVERFR